MFFSIKTTVKIMGKVYTPCVCYPVTDILAPTIDKMVAEGKAYKYADKVFFQNGKVIEKKETAVCDECDNNLGGGACTGNSKNGMVDTTGELKCFEKKQKKGKKEAPTEDEVPSPEEVADDLGGF